MLALLVLGPLVVALDWSGAADKLTIFVLAAVALIPLAWLIGEATDRAADYTGPGIGGFLNATFGNAPELIIALVAISDGLTDVVRASLVGSVVGNLLLVLGFTLLLGRTGAIDRMSVAIALATVALTTVLLLLTSVPGFHGDPDRRGAAKLALPVAVLLLAVRITVNRRALRRQRALSAADDPPSGGGWRFASRWRLSLGLPPPSSPANDRHRANDRRPHLSEFFVAIVIIAIVGPTKHEARCSRRRGGVRLRPNLLPRHPGGGASYRSSLCSPGRSHRSHSASGRSSSAHCGRCRGPGTRAVQRENDTAGRGHTPRRVRRSRRCVLSRRQPLTRTPAVSGRGHSTM